MRAHILHAGRAISYLDAVSGGARATARSLVLLHAFPLSAEMWESQLAAVPPGWRFIAPDLRGFGGSDPGGSDTAPSIDDYGEDLAALLDALGIDRVVLAGLSMGGYAAFSMMRRQPERVAGLVLADTRAEADGESARAARDAMLETVTRGGAAAVFETMQPGLLGRTTRAVRPEVVARVRALAAAQSAEGLRQGILRLKSRPDAGPQLDALACPTLVVVGAEDQITTPDVARSLHERVAGSALVVIPKAGHLSSLEQPHAFNAALTAFLESL